MRGRARRHAAADTAAVEHDHRTSAGGELIGGGQPGNARADHHHIGSLVAVELAAHRQPDVHPERFGAFFGDVHAIVSDVKRDFGPHSPHLSVAPRSGRCNDGLFAPATRPPTPLFLRRKAHFPPVDIAARSG